MKCYKVLTPGGAIYCDTASEAAEYKKLYGYYYVLVDKPQ